MRKSQCQQESWSQGSSGGINVSMGSIHARRLKKDTREVFARDFNTVASSVKVSFDGDLIRFVVCTHEGPYRRGTFEFTLQVPETYPFTSPSIRAITQLWHPNVSLTTGDVQLPHSWSPVLTLEATIMSVQLLLLEPCSRKVMNMEAYAMHSSDPIGFEQHIQGLLLDTRTNYGEGFQCHLCRRTGCLGTSHYDFHGYDDGGTAAGYRGGSRENKAVKRPLSDVTDSSLNAFVECDSYSAEEEDVYMTMGDSTNKRLRLYLKEWSANNGSTEVGDGAGDGR